MRAASDCNGLVENYTNCIVLISSLCVSAKFCALWWQLLRSEVNTNLTKSEHTDELANTKVAWPARVLRYAAASLLPCLSARTEPVRCLGGEFIMKLSPALSAITLVAVHKRRLFYFTAP